MCFFLFRIYLFVYFLYYSTIYLLFLTILTIIFSNFRSKFMISFQFLRTQKLDQNSSVLHYNIHLQASKILRFLKRYPFAIVVLIFDVECGRFFMFIISSSSMRGWSFPPSFSTILRRFLRLSFF